MEDFSLDDLFSELEDVQKEEKKPAHSFKIASESVPDLMKMLIDNDFFGEERVYFTGKKEYILRSHLLSEIEEHILTIGRIEISSLEQLSDVDESIILSLIPEINKVVLRNQEAFSCEYLHQLTQEIFEMLSVKGSCTIQQLCEEYNLGLSFFNDFFLPEYMFRENKEDFGVPIIKKKNFLYTSKYLHRLESTLTGYFTSVTAPIRMNSSEFLLGLFSTTTTSTSSSIPQISSAQCIKIVKKLVKSGRLSGRFLGETFFPKIFDDQVKSNVISFLNQNVCMSYDYIRDNFLPFGSEKELIWYLKKNVLKGAANRNKYKYFEHCVGYTDLIEIKIGVQVQEAIQDMRCVDLHRTFTWLKRLSEDEKNDLFDKIFGFNEEEEEEDDDDDTKDEEEEEENQSMKKVKLIEGIIVPVGLIHKIFFTEECEKSTEDKFRKLIKSNVPISRLQIEDSDLESSLVGWIKPEDDPEEAKYFLEEVKRRIVHPYLEKMFSVFKEENKSIGGKYSSDRERKRKLTIKKAEKEISRVYFDLSLYLQGIEILGTKIKQTSSNNSSIPKNLPSQLDKYLQQTLCRDIIEHIKELKLLEFRITSGKLPEEETKIIKRLSTIKPTSKFLESLKDYCVMLNVYLSPFTKKNRKIEIREKRERMKLKISHLSFDESSSSTIIEEEENNNFLVIESLPMMVEYLVLKLIGQNCFVHIHGRHVNQLLKLLDVFLVRKDREDIKNQLDSCYKLCQKYVMEQRKKLKNLQQQQSPNKKKNRKKKQQQQQTKKTNWKNKKKNKKRRGKKKQWMEDSSSESEEEEEINNIEEKQEEEEEEEEENGEVDSNNLENEIINDLRNELSRLKILILLI